MARGRQLAVLARFAVTVASAGACAALSAAPLPDVDALLSHETHQLMANGVTRVDTWQERLVRRGDQVWTERVLPSHRHGESPRAEHVGHRHFNGDTSARWLTRHADGRLEVKLVDRHHKVVVEIPRAEFGTVGFDGSFDAAASIVPPAVAQGMRMTSEKVSPHVGFADARWRADRSQGWSHRVLWSPSRQIAMRVESRRDDGNVRSTVTVQLLPTAGVAPWQQVRDYAVKRYDDFMD